MAPEGCSFDLKILDSNGTDTESRRYPELLITTWISATESLRKKYRNNKNVFNLSQTGNLKEAAKNLYKTLRKIKNLKYKKINVVKIPNKNLGIAINDRLKRASN